MSDNAETAILAGGCYWGYAMVSPPLTESVCPVM